MEFHWLSQKRERERELTTQFRISRPDNKMSTTDWTNHAASNTSKIVYTFLRSVRLVQGTGNSHETNRKSYRDRSILIGNREIAFKSTTIENKKKKRTTHPNRGRFEGRKKSCAHVKTNVISGLFFLRPQLSLSYYFLSLSLSLSLTLFFVSSLSSWWLAVHLAYLLTQEWQDFTQRYDWKKHVFALRETHG